MHFVHMMTKRPTNPLKINLQIKKKKNSAVSSTILSNHWQICLVVKTAKNERLMRRLIAVIYVHCSVIVKTAVNDRQ